MNRQRSEGLMGTDRALRGLNRVLKLLCVTLFAAVVVIVVWQVFSRQVLNSPPSWTGPAAQYSFIWLIFTGATWMFAEREHIAVDFFAKVLRINRTRTVELIVQAVIFGFSALLLVWGGSRAVVITWTQAIPGLPFTTGMMCLVLPISGVLICLITVHQAVRALRVGDVGGPVETAEGAL